MERSTTVIGEDSAKGKRREEVAEGGEGARRRREPSILEGG
jgi:hypothetical protein